MTSDSFTAYIRTKYFRAIKSCGLAAILVAACASVTPAQAQSSDTWKSIAIIGGSTAAGAYIGHKVGGTTGAYVGAAAGAATGYAIDRRRRQNEYYSNDYYGDNGGNYGNGNYRNNDTYSRNGGYSGGSSNDYPDPYANDRRSSRRR